MVYRACTCIWPLQVSKIADDDSISTAQRRVLLVTMVVMELVGGIILSMLSPFYPLVVRAPSVGMPPPCACNLSFDGFTTRTRTSTCTSTCISTSDQSCLQCRWPRKLNASSACPVVRRKRKACRRR